MDETKNKMNENNKETQKYVKTMEIILLERLPKSDIEIQGNLMKIRRNILLEINHLCGIFYHNM